MVSSGDEPTETDPKPTTSNVVSSDVDKKEPSKSSKENDSTKDVAVKTAIESKSEAAVAVVDEKDKGERETWKGSFDFLVNLVAYAVGFGNIWRFPYLCYRHGGGTFLAVYAIFFVVLAIPAFFLEVLIGQYTGLGASEVWKIAPIFKGVGIATLVLNFLVAAYYHVLIAWSGYYLFFSMRKDFPWENCGDRPTIDSFLAEARTGSVGEYPTVMAPLNDSGSSLTCYAGAINSTVQYCMPLATEKNDSLYYDHCNYTTQSSVESFFFNRMLHDSYDIFKFEGINWELIIILIIVEIVIYFCIWKGITKARVFIYFSAIFPYFIIVTLVIKGATLPGALEGIKFYIIPRDFKDLLKIDVWKDVGTQICFSYSIGFGALTSLGAYNKFHHNAYRDAILTCFINGGTSILAGFAVFSIIGHLAFLRGQEVGDVITQGPGLSFIAYPEVITRVQPKQLWAVLFFLMMVLLGLDTQVCFVESFYASLEDKFAVMKRRKKLCVFLLMCLLFLFGIMICTHAGNHYIMLFDNYGASGISVLFVVFWEVVGITYAFGTKRISTAVEQMLGFRPSWFWIIMWRFVTPLLLLGTFIGACVMSAPQRYAHNNELWPLGARILGWLLGCCSMVCIPGYAVYYIVWETRDLPWKERFKKGVNAVDDFNAKRINRAKEEKSKLLESEAASQKDLEKNEADAKDKDAGATATNTATVNN